MHGTSGSLHGHFHSLCIRRAGWRYICNMGGCVAQPRNFFSFHRKNHMGIHVPDTYTDGLSVATGVRSQPGARLVRSHYVPVQEFVVATTIDAWRRVPSW